MVLCFQVQVTQLTGSHWVVLGVEFIKALEGLSALQGNNKRHNDLIRLTKRGYFPHINTISTGQIDIESFMT